MNPACFIEHFLQMPLYPWQRNAVGIVAPSPDRRKAAICTPNGAGKSERIVAGCILYWLAMFPKGRVIVTTKDGRQLEGQILPAVRAHRQKFPEWKWSAREIETPTGGYARFWTTDDPGRAEGWHKMDDMTGPLLVIVDEAKSVQDPIFQALDRCTFNCQILVSSPGAKAGRFYDAFTRDRDRYHTVQAGLADCPHIPEDRVQDILHAYGPEHPFTRSTLYGEFMAAEDMEEYVFSVDSVERCARNPPPHRTGERVAFCDFAKGGDENALAVREGNKITHLVGWREADEMAAVGQFIRLFRDLGVEPTEVWGDGGGDIGKKMCDLLASAGWPINRINFGQPAHDGAVYLSWGSEAWHELSREVDRCTVILPECDVLKAQLTSRKHVLNNRGKLGLESKFELRRRGIRSPDRGDVVCGAFAVRPARIIRAADPPMESWREVLQGDGLSTDYL